MRNIQAQIATHQQEIRDRGLDAMLEVHALLDAGVYFAPSAFEAAFLSGAHGDDEIRRTLEAADGAFAQVQG